MIRNQKGMAMEDKSEYLTINKNTSEEMKDEIVVNKLYFEQVLERLKDLKINNNIHIKSINALIVP